MININMANTKFKSFQFPFEKGKVREFANAIYDPNPIYRDSQYAKSQGFSDVIIPPTFPMTALFHVESDNIVLEVMQKLGMDPIKSVHGEIEYTYERPICAGESLRGEINIGNIYEKAGKRGGTMTFVELEIKLFDTTDRLVAIVRNTFIEKG